MVITPEQTKKLRFYQYLLDGTTQKHLNDWEKDLRRREGHASADDFSEKVKHLKSTGKIQISGANK